MSGMSGNSKEIIKKVINFENPERIGLDFNLPNQKDIAWIVACKLVNSKYSSKENWGYYEEELKEIPGFKGEIKRDPYGNIYGRLEGKTKGECVKGALENGWELLEGFEMPSFSLEYENELKKIIKANEGRFLLGALPVAVFSTFRDLRKIDNALMDTVLEEENLKKLLEKIEKLAIEIIRRTANMGFDGVIIYDDWGTQKSLLISPLSWRSLFKPVYKRLVEEAHSKGMKFFIHSCGYVYEIIEDFIEVGVDVLQFDQPELLGVKKLASEFGGRVTFWSPVDIQKIMQTGDRVLIEAGAHKMIDCFKKFKGGFIAKDYPTWEDINVKDEWAQWARDVFISKSEYNDL